MEGLYKNVTLNDIQLASLYYPILIDLANHKHTLTYSELITRAKSENSENPVVQRAIPVSTGRKLDVVRIFTKERKLPDLTSLVISKGSGECGDFYCEHFDPVVAREEVFSFNWSDVSTEFDLYIQDVKNELTPRKSRKKDEAKELMHKYYMENKSSLPVNIKMLRELIIDLLMDGHDIEDAFESALQLSNKLRESI